MNDQLPAVVRQAVPAPLDDRFQCRIIGACLHAPGNGRVRKPADDKAL